MNHYHKAYPCHCHLAQCYLFEVKILRPRQNGHQFPHDIFKCIFLNETVEILFTISHSFVLKGLVNNLFNIGSDNGLAPGRRQVIFLNKCWHNLLTHICGIRGRWANLKANHNKHRQRFLTPGHQGWNDLHRLCRIGMEYYLPNNDNNINNSNNNNNNNNNNKTMMMMIIIIRMMTMMIIGTTTIMIMIIIITTTLTMTIMTMIMIKTAQTPCQSL